MTNTTEPIKRMLLISLDHEWQLKKCSWTHRNSIQNLFTEALDRDWSFKGVPWNPGQLRPRPPSRTSPIVCQDCRLPASQLMTWQRPGLSCGILGPACTCSLPTKSTGNSKLCSAAPPVSDYCESQMSLLHHLTPPSHTTYTFIQWVTGLQSKALKSIH